jgi:hypothetical protein
MARACVQLTPTWISLLEGRELVRQKYLSPARAGQLLVEWLAANLVGWRYADIQNNSGVPEIALSGFWRSAGLAIDWEGSSAARRVEPAPAGARGGVLPSGIVWSSPLRPMPRSSQLGNNFVVYGIRLAREDIESQLGTYDESPAAVANPAPPPAPAVEPLMEPPVWLTEALVRHPRRRGEAMTDYAERLSGLMRGDPVTKVWPPGTMRRRLHERIVQERKIAQERRIAQKRRRDL